jgi:hypothetical protein
MDKISNPWAEYRQQRNNAKRRGIPFLLAYEAWCKIWDESGFYHLRGRNRFVMGRINDEGPYEIGNVEIISADDNFRQAMEIHYGGERNYT